MASRTPLHVNVSAPDGAVAASRGLAPWLSRTAPAIARGEVTIALVSDRRMRALNRMFRGQDRATDVLSFPTGDAVTRGEGQSSLGDIAIALGVATRQATEHGHALATELRVLALHGLLHLLGYDHETDAGRMARAEARLRTKGGLPGGLIGRSATATAVARRARPGADAARRR